MRRSLTAQINEQAEWSSVEAGIFADSPKKKLAIVGIGSGVGTSFVATNLAYLMAKDVDGVSYVEAAEDSKRVGAYYSVPLNRVLSRKRAVDYYALANEGLAYGSRRNLYANVNWAVRLPQDDTVAARQRGKEKTEGVSEFFRSEAAIPSAGAQGFALRGGDGLMYERIPGRYLILDEAPIARLTEADLVICVLDPLPSRLHDGMEKLICLRENRMKAGRRFSPVLNLPTPVIWVLNKDNPQVSHRELEQLLKIRFDYVLPLMDERFFYRAEYSGVPIFKLPDFTRQGQAEFEPLAKQILSEMNCTI